MRHAMILAAGRGTRLAPLTDERPKPLIEVLGAPLIEYALVQAARAGARRVAINSHHLHPAVPEVLGDRYLGMELLYTHEESLLGTGGGARGLASKLDLDEGPILLLNADALTDIDVRALVENHHARKPLATLALREAPDAAAYGLIGVDDNGRVLSFAGKHPPRGHSTRAGMFCGVHVFEPMLLDRFPPGEVSCFSDAGYPQAIMADHEVNAVFHQGFFSDVGTAERLFKSSMELLTGTARLRCGVPEEVGMLLGRGAVDQSHVSDDARIHPTARLRPPVWIARGAFVDADARVGPNVVVGPRARVSAGAHIHDAVLLSGAMVEADEVLAHGILGAQHWVPIDSGGVRGH